MALSETDEVFDAVSIAPLTLDDRAAFGGEHTNQLTSSSEALASKPASEPPNQPVLH